MNYPCGIKKNKNKTINYSNRGMGLEDDINITNEYYLNNGIAAIYKKPVPITISKVDYPSRYEAVIKEAYFKTPSTTDYNGIYNGKYIDFEAKETKLKNYFPLSNIHPHQLKHLQNIINMGGIGFIIVRFTSLNETYLLDGKTLFNCIKETTKSIPYNYFSQYGHIIDVKYSPRLDYIKVLDKLYFGGDIDEKDNQ